MPEIKKQAGCLPVRLHKGKIQVLLVTSRYSAEWIAPKGNIDPGENSEEAAARECEEEAGVCGELVGCLGKFDYARGGGVGRVKTYVLRVTSKIKPWPEKGERHRQWFSLDGSFKEVHRAEVLEMLRSLREALHTQKIILTE